MSSIVLIFYSFLSVYNSLGNSLLRKIGYSSLLLVLFSSADVWAGENLQAKEYLVKSAFLYNFARLSQWPEGTFKSPADPFKLCFMGVDSFGQTLNSIKNKKINGHPLLIKRRVSLEQAAECQLLFISRSEEKKLQHILSYLQAYPVLTVSELPGFAHKNGHIRLFLNDEHTLSLEINLQAIRNAGLRISSRILTLATIVETDKIVETDTEADTDKEADRTQEGRDD